MYYVYVLRCAGETLYCGSTGDFKKRLREHFLGLAAAAKYTKSHPPKSVAALWEAPDKTSALKLEYRFKRLKKEQKLCLIENPEKVNGAFCDLAEFVFAPLSPPKTEDIVK